MPRLATPLVVLVLALALAACGGGDDGGGESAAVETTTTTTEAAAGADAGGALPDACGLVPTEDLRQATGLTLTEGVPAGDERRSVCAFSATEPGATGLTVGVEAGGRFDEKADVSRNALGMEGEEVAGLGDRALFFYSDEDIPEGVGGVLVASGDLTLDVTLQGVGDEASTRAAAVAVADVAVGNL